MCAHTHAHAHAEPWLCALAEGSGSGSCGALRSKPGAALGWELWWESTAYLRRRGWEGDACGKTWETVEKGHKERRLVRAPLSPFLTWTFAHSRWRQAPSHTEISSLPACSLLSKQRLYTEKGTFLYFGYGLLFLKLHPPNIFPYPYLFFH